MVIKAATSHAEAGMLNSILAGLAGLGLAMVAALALTVTRTAHASDISDRDKAAGVLLTGIAVQCAHFTEEFITRFYERFPEFLRLQIWTADFFVAFNLFWIAVWTLSAMGLRRNIPAAYFAAWFFAIAMAINGIAHPLLALAAGGYFPGLITSPAAGIVGFILIRRLWRLTNSRRG